MALGAKHQGQDVKVYTLLGDGECQEGQIWEAFMSAAHYKLDNLTVIIDNNGLQIDGRNDEVMSLGDLPASCGPSASISTRSMVTIWMPLPQRWTLPRPPASPSASWPTP